MHKTYKQVYNNVQKYRWTKCTWHSTGHVAEIKLPLPQKTHPQNNQKTNQKTPVTV